MNECRMCGDKFQIEDEDLLFYKKINVPKPTLCPNCRLQRRLCFRNERSLYKRKCDLCQKDMVAIFDKNVAPPVYCKDCWWSDKWDPLEYGMDFDFSRGFFDQFSELVKAVPKMGMLHLNNENSDYNTLLAFSKNTYMSPGSYYMEDCYYARKSQYCKDCLDSNFIDHCELVRYGINCNGCYNCKVLINCKNCKDSAFLADCTGLSDCFMCSGIFQQRFCFKNEKYSEEEYRKLVSEKFKESFDDLLKEFLEFNKTIPKKFQNLINCENSSGDYLQDCKNAKECYDCFDIEDCKYMIENVSVKDSMDLCMHDKDIELCYELCSGGDRNKNLKFSFCSCVCDDSEYLWTCFNMSDSFGCDGFHSKQSNCILNKKYSKDEYDYLKKKIIDHMREHGEYGEFLPPENSLYGYNETIANDYYPLSKEEALSRGYKWRDKDSKEYLKSDYIVPDRIEDTEDNVINELLTCEDCGKNYRILKQELDLCRKIELTLSKKCPDCRLMMLLKWKNPRKLWDRKCDKCGVDIKTTYSPDRGEKVLCEKCYLARI